MAKSNTTRNEIARAAMKLFLEKGYSATSPRMISQALDISTGTMTYYFPTKEHLLTVLVECMFKFHDKWCMDNRSHLICSLRDVCMEFAVMVAGCDASPVVRDLYTSVYHSPMSLELIRKMDGQRARQVYAEYCAEWDEEQFVAAEEMVSGIEFSALMLTSDAVTERTRIAASINAILMIYGVPEALRQATIEDVLSSDYRNIALQLLEQFEKFTLEDTENLLDAILPPPRKLRNSDN